MPYSQEQLTEAFDRVKDEANPIAPIDTVLEIKMEDIALIKAAVLHFKETETLILPHGPGREPDTWVCSIRSIGD